MPKADGALDPEPLMQVSEMTAAYEDHGDSSPDER